MADKPLNPRLGRGLAALIGDLGPAQGRAVADGIQLIPISSLRPGSFQPRQAMAPDGLEHLAASIRASGILQPILVRAAAQVPGEWDIIAGERRWRAAQLAGLHDVPCLARVLTDAEAMAAALAENLQRQDLNAIEEAEGYRRLANEFGLRQDDIAKIIGRSRAHVANTLRLLNLPPSVQGEVRAGNLSAGHARALLAHSDPQRAALQVIARELNVRQTEALCQPRPPTSVSAKDSNLLALERDLSGHLGLKVIVDQRGRDSIVSITCNSVDQLDSVVTLLLQQR